MLAESCMRSELLPGKVESQKDTDRPKELDSWQHEAGSQAEDRLKESPMALWERTHLSQACRQLPRQVETGLYKVNCHVGLWQDAAI